MTVELTIKYIRENASTPWPESMEASFKDYINETYIVTKRITDYIVENSDDQLTKLVRRIFADQESFMLFRNDPNLQEIKAQRKKYMLENNIVMFTTVDYPDD